jgi:hypothetical protein
MTLVRWRRFGAVAMESARLLAAMEYGPAWLGLWCAEDEALTMLTVLSESAQMSGTDLLKSRAVIGSLVARTAMGDAAGSDLSHEYIKAIAPWPHQLLVGAAAIEPEAIEEIKRAADMQLAGSVSTLRQVVGDVGRSGLGALTSGALGRELVHTNYFESSRVIELVAAFIRRDAVQQPSESGWLAAWRRFLSDRLSLTAGMSEIASLQRRCFRALLPGAAIAGLTLVAISFEPLFALVIPVIALPVLFNAHFRALRELVGLRRARWLIEERGARQSAYGG